MEKQFTITLSDGTVLDNIGLTGNNYISKKKIKDEVFSDTALKRVEILDKETGDIEVLENQALVQNIKYEDEYWFIFRTKSDTELLAEVVEAQAELIQALETRVETLEHGDIILVDVMDYEAPSDKETDIINDWTYGKSIIAEADGVVITEGDGNVVEAGIAEAYLEEGKIMIETDYLAYWVDLDLNKAGTAFTSTAYDNSGEYGNPEKITFKSLLIKEA